MKAKKVIDKILAYSLFASMFLPMFTLAAKSRHNCMYDECLRIVNDLKCGMCIEKAIDNLYMTIAVLWFFVIIGSLLVFSKGNSISPFVVIGMFLSVSIFGAFVDPSKWTFVISLLPSLVILIIAVVLDSRNKNQ